MMKPHRKPVFTKETKALFKDLADQIRAKREAATTKPASPVIEK